MREVLQLLHPEDRSRARGCNEVLTQLLYDSGDLSSILRDRYHPDITFDVPRPTPVNSRWQLGERSRTCPHLSIRCWRADPSFSTSGSSLNTSNFQFRRAPLAHVDISETDQSRSDRSCLMYLGPPTHPSCGISSPSCPQFLYRHSQFQLRASNASCIPPLPPPASALFSPSCSPSHPRAR